MITVGELKERYWPLILSKVSPGTGRAYKSAWNTRVGPSFAHREIASISPLDVEAEFAVWPGARSTRIDALSLLSAICRVAVKGGFIGSNPCQGAEIPRARESDPSSRALTVAEVDRLIEALPTSGPYRRFVLAMLYTGCRLGEIAGLRVGDADLAARTIHVARTASPGLNGELVVGPTKGRRVRMVPLAEPLVSIIIEAAQGKGPHDLLFPGPRGGYINSKNLSRALDWANVRDTVKSFPPGEEPLHWHDLRHTAAVVLFLAGVSPPDVQAILGHASLAVTQLYSDTRRDAAKRGTAALSNFWAGNRRGQHDGGESAAITGA
ncbi:tyrosine-type recombinase/integrase [Microbacterium sp. RG1]|uniref:tyrosine-type recombinase/integrase n=1 Tax=Microbacterium sp. RG1 TaxID=2489212 RepID=UPI001375C74C|nr:site-specific integrase [Microbacterium sp. RG1]